MDLCFKKPGPSEKLLCVCTSRVVVSQQVETLGWEGIVWASGEDERDNHHNTTILDERQLIRIQLLKDHEQRSSKRARRR